MSAVAYIRRSHSGEAQASEETQRETVQRLATERGDPIAHVYRDWGKSGGSETRPEYMAMLAAIEAGTVKSVYAYDQDRLARSIWLFAGLLRLADIYRLKIITTAGDLADDDRRDFAEMRGVMDGGELRKITKRNHANLKRMKDRGDDFGVAPFGYEKRRALAAGHEQRCTKRCTCRVVIERTDLDGIAHVIEAYRAAGTFLAAARALNEEGFTTHRGKQWHPTQVREVIRREAPDLMVNGIRRGTRGPGKPRYFAGLLRCFCGSVMTPGGSIAKPRYYCARSARGGHPLPHGISESRLMPWIKAEAAKLVDPDSYYRETDAFDDSENRRGLEAIRAAIGEDAYLLAVSNLDAKRAERGERERLELDVPDRIDWERWDAEGINRALRSLWHGVQLGADLLPVAAEWKVPTWRRAD